MAPLKDHPTPPAIGKDQAVQTHPQPVVEPTPPANVRQEMPQEPEDDLFSSVLEQAGFREVREFEPFQIRIFQHHPDSPDTHVDVLFTPPPAPSDPQN